MLSFDPTSAFVGRPGDDRADRDPLPRRPGGRGRDAPEGMASAASQARARDADHRGARRGWRRKALTDLSWTESFLVGALLCPTDPVLSSSVVTNPRVPRHRAPLAQPRVRASTTASRCPRCSPSAPRCASATTTSCGGASSLQDVTLGARLRGRRRAWRPPGSCPAAGADRGAWRRTRRRSTRWARRSWPTASRCCRRRATASSPCSCARSRSGSCVPTSASASTRALRTSSSSSSSRSSSCSARC